MKALKQTELNTAIVVETPWSNVLKISAPQGPVLEARQLVVVAASSSQN